MSTGLPISQWPNELTDYPADWLQYFAPAGDDVPGNVTEKATFANWQRLMQGRAANIAVLRALVATTIPNGTTLLLDGHTNPTVGGGLFVLNNSGTVGANMDDNGLLVHAAGGPPVTDQAAWYWDRRAIVNEVKPEHYGAVGDGTTDDTVAVQAAINAGYCVLQRGKTYLLNSPLTMPEGGVLNGNGATLKAGAALSRQISVVSKNDIRIFNTTFLGQCSEYNVYFETSKGIKFHGNTFEDAVIATYWLGVTFSQITSNTFLNGTRNCVILRPGSSYNVVGYNTVEHNAGATQHCLDIEATGGQNPATYNTFIGNTVNSTVNAIQITGENAQYNTCVGNTMAVSGGGTIPGIKLDGCVDAVVSSNIIDGAYGLTDAGLRTNAIGNFVRPTGNGISITNPGAGGGTSGDGQYIGNRIIANGASAGRGISTNRPNNHIEGNYIQGFVSDGINADDAAATNITIINNVIVGSGRYGIYTSGVNATVQNTVIRSGTGTYAALFLGNDTTVLDVELISNSGQLLRFGGAAQTGTFVRTRNAAWLNNFDPGNTSWTP